MKPKALTTKLSLNKVTISDLSDEKMQNVLGGTDNTNELTCFTYVITKNATLCPNLTCRFRFCDATVYPNTPC